MDKKTFRIIHDIIFFSTTVIVLALFSIFFRIGTIPSNSMLPTYEVDDVIIIRDTQTPQLDKVVLFYRYNEEGRTIYIKRCVGLPGDRIAVKNGRLWRNGEPIDEPYLNEKYIVGDFDEITVSEGMMFVMGDNRNNSYDSRFFGPVPIKDMIGRPVVQF